LDGAGFTVAKMLYSYLLKISQMFEVSDSGVSLDLLVEASSALLEPLEDYFDKVFVLVVG
jgi:hypothetical protein